MPSTVFICLYFYLHSDISASSTSLHTTHPLLPNIHPVVLSVCREICLLIDHTRRVPLVPSSIAFNTKELPSGLDEPGSWSGFWHRVPSYYLSPSLYFMWPYSLSSGVYPLWLSCFRMLTTFIRLSMPLGLPWVVHHWELVNVADSPPRDLKTSRQVGSHR